ncbi:MAG: tRNA (adenosine(37)-N6)-threonylcarbamoyltransferase complex dimerization subunit type 1 TsaB [Firmicutes bacterium]|jgi:tRNA threonylcarbamoyladenosine biosynthesis protein TsaB|nr:tRNA (adenosine(37)-N6)-threonylcarbamoyltransferase complex dimerization subunit type 1 TsaB [Bacillota bacterium]
MRVLGIDTSLPTGTVGLIDGVHILYEGRIPIRPGGGERIPALIDKALQVVGWRPEYLDLVAVGRGPGSYTGVRVGLAIGKGIAYSLGIPMVGVNTLLALAANNPGWPGLLCPVLDARRGRVYTGLYLRKEQGNWVELRPPELCLLAELTAELKKEKTPVLFVGQGARLYREEITAALGPAAVFHGKEEGEIDQVSGVTVAFLGLLRWQKKNEDELFTCLPLYLQRTEAEIRWGKGE